MVSTLFGCPCVLHINIIKELRFVVVHQLFDQGSLAGESGIFTTKIVPTKVIAIWYERT